MVHWSFLVLPASASISCGGNNFNNTRNFNVSLHAPSFPPSSHEPLPPERVVGVIARMYKHTKINMRLCDVYTSKLCRNFRIKVFLFGGKVNPTDTISRYEATEWFILSIGTVLFGMM